MDGCFQSLAGHQEVAIVQVQLRDGRAVLRHEVDGRIRQEVAILQVQHRDGRAVLGHEADGRIRQRIQLPACSSYGAAATRRMDASVRRRIAQVQHRDARAVLRHEADRFIREIWCSVYSHNIGLVLQNESLNSLLRLVISTPVSTLIVKSFSCA